MSAQRNYLNFKIITTLILATDGFLLADPDFSVEIITLSINASLQQSLIPLIDPAIDLAVQEIQSQYGQVFKLKHTYLLDQSIRTCTDLEAVSDNLLAQYYYQKRAATNMTAIITPGCTYSTIQNARLAQGWNLPIIFGGAASSNGLKNRSLFPNAISAGYANLTPYQQIFISMMTSFQWKHVYVLYDDRSAIYAGAVAGMAAALRNLKDSQIYYKSVPCSRNSIADFTPLLEEFRQTARVLTYGGHMSCFRLLMIAAHKLKMTDGNFVYLAAEVEKGTLLIGSVDWRNNDQYDQIARKAFESVLVLTPFEEKKNALFENKLKFLSWNNYGYKYKENEKPGQVIKSMYECFHMFAMVLNDTINAALRDGVAWNPEDGQTFIKKFLGHKFTLPTGSTFIDKTGERVNEVAVNQMDNLTDQLVFKTVYRQESSYAFYPVAPVVWPVQWPPPDKPECGFSGKDGPCQQKEASLQRNAVAGASVAVLLLFCLCGIGARQYLAELKLKARSWDLPLTALVLPDLTMTLTSGKACAGRYLAREVWLKLLPPDWRLKESRAIKVLLLKMQAVSHLNISSFIGIIQSPQMNCLVTDFCVRGSLHKLLTDHNVSVDGEFKQNIIHDILAGLSYLHTSPLHFHGSLSTRNCLLDKHFTVKIGEAAYKKLFLIALNKSKCSLWNAPDPPVGDVTEFGPAADIYALGLILYCVLTDSDLNTTYSQSSLPDLNMLKCHPVIKTLIAQSWSDQPKLRPTINRMTSQYSSVVQHKTQTFVERLLNRMQKYSHQLEEAVAERTHQLQLEREKCDEILFERLPRSVVERLRSGGLVDPESFESVTISFSNLSGFAEFAAKSTPYKVVTFLNQSHSLFDNVVFNFEVYKVETINDSYVVASGLPIRNELKHASEMCSLALTVRESIRSAFGDTEMRLQVGMHTGACVAAVVGFKQPSYCIFGDTMNTASRMESSGETDKIQLSLATAALVKSCMEFKLIYRGLVVVKGKGEMATFWLEPGMPPIKRGLQ